MVLLPICNSSTDAFWTTCPLSGFVHFWLAYLPQYLTLHEHIININSFTKIDTGEKNHFCHRFLTSLPCVPLMTPTSSAARIWWSTFTEVFLLKPSCLSWHVVETGTWFLGEERLTTSQSRSEELPAAPRGRSVSQSPRLPPLVHSIYLQTLLEVKLRKALRTEEKKKKKKEEKFLTNYILTILWKIEEENFNWSQITIKSLSCLVYAEAFWQVNTLCIFHIK